MPPPRPSTVTSVAPPPPFRGSSSTSPRCRSAPVSNPAAQRRRQRRVGSVQGRLRAQGRRVHRHRAGPRQLRMPFRLRRRAARPLLRPVPEPVLMPMNILEATTHEGRGDRRGSTPIRSISATSAAWQYHPTRTGADAPPPRGADFSTGFDPGRINRRHSRARDAGRLPVSQVTVMLSVGRSRRDVADREAAAEVVRRGAGDGRSRGGRPSSAPPAVAASSRRAGGLASGRATRDRRAVLQVDTRRRSGRSIRRRGGRRGCTGRCWSCVWWASHWGRGRSPCGRAGSRCLRRRESCCRSSESACWRSSSSSR